jgi:polysaccharide export outer membrane protein
MDELGENPYPIDLEGNINLPRVGRVHAAGVTVEELEGQLTKDFLVFLRDPIVNVNVAEYHSQPVSVLGAVNNPGVHQIQGNKTLFEVISEAGGLRDDAGSTIEVTRRLTNGVLPLPNATTDATGSFSIAGLNIRAVMAAKSPEQNIPVKPNDVITVPKADLVYVIGSVKHPGGFPLQEKSTMSVLQALSLAEGLQNTAAGTRAKILRNSDAKHGRVEIPINVKHILAGTDADVPLLADDILFVPNSTGKAASLRAVEALIQTGSGVAIYTHPF